MGVRSSFLNCMFGSYNDPFITNVSSQPPSGPYSTVWDIPCPQGYRDGYWYISASLLVWKNSTSSIWAYVDVPRRDNEVSANIVITDPGTTKRLRYRGSIWEFYHLLENLKYIVDYQSKRY